MSATGWKEATPLIKYPSEKLTRTMDASGHIPDGATVSGVSIKVYDPAGTETTSTMISGTPTVAAASVFTVQAGTANTEYDIVGIFTLSNGDTPKLILPMQVVPE